MLTALALFSLLVAAWGSPAVQRALAAALRRREVAGRTDGDLGDPSADARGDGLRQRRRPGGAAGRAPGAGRTSSASRARRRSLERSRLRRRAGAGVRDAPPGAGH